MPRIKVQKYWNENFMVVDLIQNVILFKQLCCVNIVYCMLGVASDCINVRNKGIPFLE